MSDERRELDPREPVPGRVSARQAMLHRLEAVTRRHGVTVAPAVWLDDLDAIEAEAHQAERERMAQAVERGEWDDLYADLVSRMLDVERLTKVLHDWMPDGADVSVGFDGNSRHLTGSDLARYIFERSPPPDTGQRLTGEAMSPDPDTVLSATTLRADLLRALDRMDQYVGTFEGEPDYSVRELGKFVSYLRAALEASDSPEKPT